MIRHAEPRDASRLAEISIFTKRMNYRSIFRNDKVSFGEMQVYPLAKSYLDDPDSLKGIWVFEDEFVKGFVTIKDSQIAELYVDSFFANQGIGSELIRFAIEEHGCDRLWVLEKNESAKRFYRRHGFAESGQRQLEEGTSEYIVEMIRA
ncbi:MAG: GNAT family N-acetyltransferase [Firmicutes bacterium]|nr:GNAT family N-acetyltransferase [Bacillota bacterium]